MWGRVRRAGRRLVGDEVVVAIGVIHSYDPMVLGSVAAVGMGAAAAGAGAALARDRSGRLVSATAQAVDRVTSWAARDSQRYASLPHSLLATVTTSRVLLCRWSPVARPGPPISWPVGSFTATGIHHRYGGSEVDIALAGGKRAVLSALSGPHHRAGRRVIAAIADMGQATT